MKRILTTGADGKVDFTGLEPGSYTVTATADEFDTQSVSATVTAKKTSPPAAVVLTFEPSSI